MGPGRAGVPRNPADGAINMNWPRIRRLYMPNTGWTWAVYRWSTSRRPAIMGCDLRRVQAAMRRKFLRIS